MEDLCIGKFWILRPYFRGVTWEEIETIEDSELYALTEPGDRFLMHDFILEHLRDRLKEAPERRIETWWKKVCGDTDERKNTQLDTLPSVSDRGVLRLDSLMISEQDMAMAPGKLPANEEYIRLVKETPFAERLKVTRLSLSFNGLNDDDLWNIVDSFRYFPNLSIVDLSRNWITTLLPLLEFMESECKHVTAIIVKRNRMPAEKEPELIQFLQQYSRPQQIIFLPRHQLVNESALIEDSQYPTKLGQSLWNAVRQAHRTFYGL